MIESFNKNRNIRRPVICGIAFLVLIPVIVFACIYIFPSASTKTIIKIPRGADSSMVADSLCKYLGQDFASRTMTAAGWMGFDASSRFGAYKIPKGYSPLRAAHVISRGRQDPVKVTINGFRSMDSMLDAISGKFYFGREDLDKVLSDKDLLDKYGLDYDSRMVLFFNDSYIFNWSDSPRHVVEKIAGNYMSFWNESRRRKVRDLELTPREISIIASIVDEETNIADEKGIIGRLYINRLKNNMRLQADPTVRFALGDFSIKRISSEHLWVESPYNTYRNYGLPPGPIRTVSASTVDSILDSAPTDYLFMCARPDFSGRHDFSRDFDTHRRNADLYRSELDRRNIHSYK